MKAFFIGAGAGAGEKHTRSRSRSKMDRLRNTGHHEGGRIKKKFHRFMIDTIGYDRLLLAMRILSAILYIYSHRQRSYSTSRQCIRSYSTSRQCIRFYLQVYHQCFGSVMNSK